MPRSPRIEYPGAVYHVMCRGDRKEPIFETDLDRNCFIDMLGEVCERAGFVVHGYVLMSNHYHLLLETPAGNLVAGMKWFQGTYTQRYNSRNRKSGHLFQGRYKAVPVEHEDPEYFRVVSDYIHLNPVRAGLLQADEGLESYLWSSFPAFISSGKWPYDWLKRERVFGSHDLPDTGRRSCRLYSQMTSLKVKALRDEESAAVLEQDWSMLRRGWFCGSDGFRDWLMNRIDEGMTGKKRESYSTEAMRGHDEKEAKRLLHDALKRLNVSLEDLRGRRQSDSIKQAVAWWIKSRTVVGDAWICRKLEMGHRMNVCRAANRYRCAEDRHTRKIKKMLQCAD